MLILRLPRKGKCRKIAEAPIHCYNYSQKTRSRLSRSATPAVIALAEETAWRSVAAYLEPGQGTVGTMLQVEHISATPVGMKVRCETELIEIDRRKLTFSVEVFDEAGVVAKGTHCRFIVENEKFLKRAEKKAEDAGVKGDS